MVIIDFPSIEDKWHSFSQVIFAHENFLPRKSMRVKFINRNCVSIPLIVIINAWSTQQYKCLFSAFVFVSVGICLLLMQCGFFSTMNWTVFVYYEFQWYLLFCVVSFFKQVTCMKRLGFVYRVRRREHYYYWLGVYCC